MWNPEQNKFMKINASFVECVVSENTNMLCQKTINLLLMKNK